MPKKAKAYEVGQEIETVCTKCKTEMLHVITVLKGTKISKVMCKGCLTTHVYKESSTSAEKSTGGTKAVGATKGRRSRKYDWPTLVNGLEESEIVDYDLSQPFAERQAIRHKKFGVGVITKIIDDGKIEVVFQDDKKVLAQNWSEF
ncbi:hypothetical protein MJD09_00555 [bacterium]|nr:hypothetical protein [bacterium]